MSLELKNRYRTTTAIFVFTALFLSLVLSACAPWYEKYNIRSDEDLTDIAAIPELCKALKDSDPEIRIKAAAALGNIGPDALSAVPDLKKAMGDGLYPVRSEAANAMEKIVGKLVDKDKKYRELMISVYMVRLESRDWMERRDAADKLGEMGPVAARAVPALIKALLDDSIYSEHYYEVRRSAARALGKMGFKARAANPALIKALDSHDYDVRIEAARALGKIGPKSDKAVIRALKKALDDPDFDVRREAAISLGAFESYGSVATDDLVKALSDQDFDVKREAAKALGKIGPKTDPVVNALLYALLNDTDEDVRLAAVLALGNVAPQYRAKVLPAVIAALNDENSRVRLGAIHTISGFGIYNDEVGQALERTGHEDKSTEVKKAALDTLIELKSGSTRKATRNKTQKNKASGKSLPKGITETAIPAAGAAAATAVPGKGAVVGKTAPPKIVKITADALNIRSGPGLAYKKLGKLFPNETPKVLEVGEKWIKVQKSNGLTGFVSKDYVVLTETAIPAAGAAAATAVPGKGAAVEKTAPPKIVKITADALNIRSGPGLAYKKLGKLFPNETPKVLEVGEKWIKVQKSNGLTGFVSKDYVVLGK